MELCNGGPGQCSRKTQILSTVRNCPMYLFNIKFYKAPLLPFEKVRKSNLEGKKIVQMSLNFS